MKWLTLVLRAGAVAVIAIALAFGADNRLFGMALVADTDGLPLVLGAGALLAFAFIFMLPLPAALPGRRPGARGARR